jgi:hypothetical protein
VTIDSEPENAGIFHFLRAGGNTYVGETLVKSGRVEIANSSGSATGTGAVTIGMTDAPSRGALAGKGTITGSVTVTNRGTVFAGGNAGETTIATGNLELKTNSTYQNHLGGFLKVTGSVKIDGGVLIIQASQRPVEGENYVLIDNDGNYYAITGALFVDFEGRALTEGSVLDVSFGGVYYRFKLTYKGNASGPDPAEANDVVLINQGVNAAHPVSWGEVKGAFR